VPRFDTPIEYQFAGEAAASLGLAARRLRKALDALRKYDADVARQPSLVRGKSRDDLVTSAGEAFWGYVVQRELLGLTDPEYIAKEYDVPSDVWQAMGPTTKRK
jgi:hypothetical protein